MVGCRTNFALLTSSCNNSRVTSWPGRNFTSKSLRSCSCVLRSVSPSHPVSSENLSHSLQCLSMSTFVLASNLFEFIFVRCTVECQLRCFDTLQPHRHHGHCLWSCAEVEARAPLHHISTAYERVSKIRRSAKTQPQRSERQFGSAVVELVELAATPQISEHLSSFHGLGLNECSSSFCGQPLFPLQ